MLGNIIAAILIGIVAGYLGRLLLPGKDPMGFVGTVIAGIIGALVGYFLFASPSASATRTSSTSAASSAPSSAR